MIVITDGVALITEDGRRPRGNEPVEHARQAVNEVRAQGVDVIGLGIGGMDGGKMEETFGGNNYRLTSIDRLASDILDLYKEQMDSIEVRR
jgi:nitric oxide reductase activation protein